MPEQGKMPYSETLTGPPSLEDVAGPQTERPRPGKPAETEEGRPGDYTDGSERCEFCRHFDEFGSPACKRFKFEATPDGHCGAFEDRGESEEAEPEPEDEEEMEEEEEE